MAQHLFSIKNLIEKITTQKASTIFMLLLLLLFLSFSKKVKKHYLFLKSTFVGAWLFHRQVISANGYSVTCGLYYKTITIVIMTIISDTTIWSVTYGQN
jgi:hypothetical protein